MQQKSHFPQNRWSRPTSQWAGRGAWENNTASEGRCEPLRDAVNLAEKGGCTPSSAGWESGEPASLGSTGLTTPSVPEVSKQLRFRKCVCVCVCFRSTYGINSLYPFP